MKLAIRHTTHYSFNQPVKYGLQRLRLKPKLTNGQSITDWSMQLEGAAHQLIYDDQNNNHVDLIAIEEGTQELSIHIRGTLETNDNAGIIGKHSGHVPLWHFCEQTELTRPGPEMRSLVAALNKETDDRLAWLHSLCTAVLEAVTYETGVTDAKTRGEEALSAGKGVCQDHAHIFIGCCRMADVPARYVSGYLLLDDRTEQDAGHGWAEAYVEGLGWIGFDVSNGICPDMRYVRVATGRDYSAAAPVTGLIYGAEETALKVTLTVEQLHSGQ